MMHYPAFNSRIAACLAIALAVAFGAPGAQAAGDKPAVVLILDSSRSMWGQIDGVNKVVIARKALASVFDTYKDKVDMGVVAFGHRKASGCTDFGTVLPLGTINPKAYNKAIGSFRPRGATPIAAALRKAAEEVGYKKRPGTIILIADGLDNCQADPCTTARKLADEGPALAIHVIAFDRTSRKKLTGLACIAEATEGIFTPAENAKELSAALANSLDAAVAAMPEMAQPGIAQAPRPAAKPAEKSAQKQASIPSPPIPVPTPKAPPPPAATTTAPPVASPPPPAPKAELKAAKTKPAKPAKPKISKVRLSAVLNEGGRTIGSGLVWRIFSGTPAAGGKFKLLSTHREAQPAIPLAPGGYVVNAAYGRATVTKRISVSENNPANETLNLKAGGMRMHSVHANGAAIADVTVSYKIFAADLDQFGNRKLLIGKAKSDLIIRLNAGTYHVISQYGDANATVRADVTVQAGQLADATFNHRAAQVTFKLVKQHGGEALSDTNWSVLSPGGDIVKESAGALPTHILAAGTYTVLARHEGNNFARDFSIVPGEVAQVEVVIP